MASSPLTASQLDRLVCSAEKCHNTACTGAMAFHSACHPADPTWAWYQDGVLTIKCTVCGSTVCAVKVASS